MGTYLDQCYSGAILSKTRNHDEDPEILGLSIGETTTTGINA